jgi:hypothetical protein
MNQHDRGRTFGQIKDSLWFGGMGENIIRGNGLGEY